MTIGRIPFRLIFAYSHGCMVCQSGPAYPEPVVPHYFPPGSLKKKTVTTTPSIRKMMGAVAKLVNGRRYRNLSIPGALGIIHAGPDRTSLEIVLREAGWNFTTTPDYAAAIALYEQDPVPIILYEKECASQGWRDEVSGLARLSPRPVVILLSRTSDENLWDEFVRHGGADIVALPVRRDALLSAMKAGWALWKNQQRLRQAAATRASEATK